MRILGRHYPALLLAMCLGIAVAAILSSLQPAIYGSRIALEVEGLNENYLDLRNVYPTIAPGSDAAGLLQTQAEIFTQDALLQRVARKLHLETRPEYLSNYTIAERLREDIRVEPTRNSRILQIVCDARDAALAASLCNSLAEDGIENAIATRQRIARQTFDSLEPRLDDLWNLFHKGSGRGHAAPDPDMFRHFFDNLMERAGDAWIASRVRQANIRIVGAAEPPSHPYKPNLPLNLSIGAIGGLVLGIGWVMLRTTNRSVLREPGEASLHLSVPELGAIPRVKRTASTAHEPDATVLSESFRAASVSIVSATRNGEHCRTLVVTSAWPTEGKTTVVHNLGKALAETSEKVLLIDGDMRRPRLHKLFDEANSWGLTDFLREPNAIDELPVEAIVKKTSVPRVYLLPSGACSENIFGLLYRERMSKMWRRFQETFDYILVDAPPCLEFADARILAHCAGELLLVVRANHTHRKAVQAAIQRIQLDGIPMIGVVLNQWDQRRSYVYQDSHSLDGFRGGVL
ncbi:MAG TPA: polysaccharide biosynthesis tyrosine autokinase [Candidatus Solibacter sp.]|nr:polysaccharide biosynthesis tyrosine autokinase [Candidatus Solibacter sp.]